MRIAITGATGMIGNKLTVFGAGQGHQVTAITRRSLPGPAAQILWDPSSNVIELEKFEGIDVVIHLSGASISERWSPEYKKIILDSRVQSTQFLSASLAKLKHKPKVLIAASAIGFYGSHDPQELLDESSPSGEGFLADVCRQWEESSAAAQQAGIRVVNMRLGVVLSRSGGALAQMWTPFKFGAGGIIGDGKQVMSWVALDEVPYVVDHLIKNDQIKGPVNVVSPQAVSNAEFTRILGQVISRPTVLPMPAFAVRLLFGEMGQSLLLEGAHVVPGVLNQTAYRFHFADLKEALIKVTN